MVRLGRCASELFGAAILAFACSAGEGPASPGPNPPPTPGPTPEPTPEPTPFPSPAISECPASGYVRVVKVSTASQLLAAVNTALPGDQIQLAAGTYPVHPTVTRSGTQANPITLCGPRAAIINPTGQFIDHSAAWWVYRGFTVTGGVLGILARNANHNVFDSLLVSGIGQQGIALKGTSSFNTVRHNTLTNLGQTIGYFGEAVYVGDGGCRCDPANHNIVEFNIIGPNVKAEAVQVNIGTSGNIVRDNQVDATGWTHVANNVTMVMWTGGIGTQFLRNTITNVPGGATAAMGSFFGNNTTMRENSVSGQFVYAYQIIGGSGNVLGCDNVKTGLGVLSNVACTP